MNTPAPWNLTGRGFILTYRFPEEFVRESSFLPDEWKEKKWTGKGFVMLADYWTSPVGPYKELLFIPGRSHFDGERLYTISKIFVDTLDSMENGRNNWGIPKELADFQWTKEERVHNIRVGGASSWFEIELETGSIPFPVHSRFQPIHLYQEMGNKKFQVSPIAKGTGHFAMIKGIKSDALYFPDLDLVEPTVALYVDPFRMVFPEGKMQYFR